ncbi:MAG: hypothetical protein OXE85_11480, partial [Roseovarius sp.]|nr:hypothetical protein [Roseovarius sp.]
MISSAASGPVSLVKYSTSNDAGTKIRNANLHCDLNVSGFIRKHSLNQPLPICIGLHFTSTNPL